jgi:hypothetical protein
MEFGCLILAARTPKKNRHHPSAYHTSHRGVAKLMRCISPTDPRSRKTKQTRPFRQTPKRNPTSSFEFNEMIVRICCRTKPNGQGKSWLPESVGSVPISARVSTCTSGGGKIVEKNTSTYTRWCPLPSVAQMNRYNPRNIKLSSGLFTIHSLLSLRLSDAQATLF